MSKIEVNQISSQCGSTLTIGQSGDTVTLASGATQTGFGRTGTVDWCTTAKTAPFTGVSGKGYFVNTTCGAVTVTLPASPSAGDIISVKDYARTAGTNNINFCRNGSKMDGVCASGVMNVSGSSVTLIYVDATKGWTATGDSNTKNFGQAFITATGGTVVTCGDYKIHTFTADGCFSVSCAGNPAGSNSVDYLVVAGGGGGGYDRAGGGGAGGYRESKAAGAPWTASPLATSTSLPVSATTYPITVGGGGAGLSAGPASADAGTGTNSIFSTITSAGGGRAGSGPGPFSIGGNGGSGGGSDAYGFPQNPANMGAGSGNTPPVSPPQGNNGGVGVFNLPNGCGKGGGGGGATTVGNPHPGGTGATSSISGSSASYSGGGGGGSCTPGAPTGGTGGGGNGSSAGTASTAATINTGGGGGGGNGGTGGNAGGSAGGSGIVIIRYKFQ